MQRLRPWMLTLCLASASCTVPESPSAPSFDIDIDIPIANERVTMSDVVSNRTDYLGTTPEGAVAILISQDVDRFDVSDQLALIPSSASITLPAPPSGSSISGDLSASFPSELSLTSAAIESGSLVLSISNGSGRTLSVSLDLPGFERDDAPVSGSVVVSGGSSGQLVLDLAGARYETTTPSRLDMEVTAAASSGGSDGLVDVSLSSNGLELQEAQGSVADLEVPFNASVQDVDFPQGDYAVSLAAAAVEFVVTNEIQAEGFLDATVIGRRQDGASVTLVLPPGQRTVAAATSSGPTETRIRLDETNSTIVDLLNLIPTSIEIQGGVVLDDPDATIRRTDGIDLGVVFEAPLTFTLGETTFLSDPEDITIDDEQVRDRLLTHVGASGVSLELTNHLPVGVGVRLLIGTDPDRLATDPDLALPTSGEILLPTPALDAASGTVTEAATQETAITLTEDDIAVFSRAPLYSRVEMRFLGTGGQTVHIRDTDYAEVRMRANVRIRIDEDLDN